jgi:hypothetical protein
VEKRRAVEELKDLYAGQTAWIVGKGPSLKHLRARYFGNGPVITMNESILLVQTLGLGNPIYSMQKDGCHMSQLPERCRMGCQVKFPMVYPMKDVTVILQDPGFSERCLPEHKKRLWVDPVQELGFELATEMSIMMCIRLSQIMGCTRINFLCCDSLIGDMRTINVHTLESALDQFAGHYAHVVPAVLRAVRKFPHEIIIPGGAE